MRRTASAAAWAALLILAALGPAMATTAVERTALIRSRYDSWTGVLRLWKCEDWPLGDSLTGWLNECAAAFEKRHPGAYVQIIDVSEETLRSFADGRVNPPDMLLYAPGMLEAPYSLLLLEETPPLKRALEKAGDWAGGRYAVPVALGGYALAINSRLLPQTPSDWREIVLAGDRRTEEVQLLNAPCDRSALSWSAALISLFAGGVKAEESVQTPVGQGIDLGLPGEPSRTEQPVETGGDEATYVLPVDFPENFRAEESVFAQFASGRIAAIPVTQREIARLRALSGQGKAPDWRAECIGLPFTDQAALYSVVAWPREDADARRRLALEFMQTALSEPMQWRLTAAQAFSAIETGDMYQAIQPMSALEAALNDERLLLPPAFGGTWRGYAQRLGDGLKAGEGTREAYRLLEEMLRAEAFG